jgi:branched-chain amino acid transport system substrate-binding protein
MKAARSIVALLAVVAIAIGGWRLVDSSRVIRIGAVFPISSNAASLAGPELAGVRIAADMVNADGGVHGRRIELVERDLRSRGDADAVMASLAAAGVRIVVGAYSSDLSIAASEAADRAGLLYWEAGAVADRLTGRGLPMVFRVGATGANLGANSAAFAADELAGRLGKSV